MKAEPEFRWTSAGRTDIGLVRTRNEDAVLEQPERCLWAVADGMGGHAYGDLASTMVVDGLRALGPAVQLVQGASQACASLLATNRALLREAAARGVPVIGSTVVVLLGHGASAACIWAGDSRIYRCRNGKLQQLTRDHNQLEELKARNHISAADALSYPASNMITRAVGAADTLDLDELTVDIDDGDVFLLCSDGLSNAVDERGIQGALVSGDCAQAADALIALALANGGRDNISVVVVRADAVNSDKTMLNPAL